MRTHPALLLVPLAAATAHGPLHAQVHVTINSSQDRQAISPYIYGTNTMSAPGWEDATLGRLGGNRWTAYNWENNASNAGSDWQHQNDGFLSNSNTPGEAVRPSIVAAHAKDQALIVTVPIAGYAAADKNGGGDVANSGPNYLSTRFNQVVAKKNAPFSLNPTAAEVADDFVYTDEFVNWVESKRQDGQPIFYSLDNEPGLWSHTHARIHPNKATYAEMVQKSVAHAAAIKDVNPDALVFGSVGYGWNEFRTLQDAPDRAGRDFHEFYLQQMKQAEQQAGRRLVDVLDLHWYPEARGGGKRIVFEDGSDDPNNAGLIAARVQAARSLYDPTYVEQSWITQFSTGNAPINLLQRVRDDVNQFYPGTKIAITEYNYGGTNHISGGIAQADALGAFGRGGVFAANWWDLTSGSDAFATAALDAYLNYDGEGSGFGDTSVRAATDDLGKTAVYASVDSDDPGRMIVVLINRTGETVNTELAITHEQLLSLAEVYQLTGASPAMVRLADINLATPNALNFAMPAYSVTTLELTAVPEPTAAAMLAAPAAVALLRRGGR